MSIPSYRDQIWNHQCNDSDWETDPTQFWWTEPIQSINQTLRSLKLQNTDSKTHSFMTYRSNYSYDSYESLQQVSFYAAIAACYNIYYIYTWPGTLQVYSQDSNPNGDESVSPYNLTSIWYQSNIVRHQMDQSEAVFLAQVLIPPSVHQSMTLASWMPSSFAGRGESGTVSTWSMRQFKYTNLQM